MEFRYFFYSIGRKKTLYICLMLLLGSSVAICYVPEYYSFVVLQFVIGTTTLGSWMAAFVTGNIGGVNGMISAF